MGESIVSSPTQLTASYLSEADWSRLRSCSDHATLAEISYGGEPASRADERISIELPQLGREPLVEVWSSGRPVSCGELGSVRYRSDDEYLFAHIEVDLDSSDLQKTGESDLESATDEIYAEVFQFLETAGYPELLRIWNYVPRINESLDGLERYRRFCRARSRAFEARYGERFVQKLCASSAVGTRGERLSVVVLASRTPGRHWENPRQVSAYRYPEQYGPRSPSFARATTMPIENGSSLFVSGTASIVGFESRHPGDTVEQCRETLRNIGVIVDCALRDSALDDARFASFSSLKIYVRNAADLDAVSSALDDRVPREVPRLFLLADICRSELDVEVEGIALSDSR